MAKFPDVPSDEHFQLTLDRLRESLAALAAPADAQIASLPDFAQWNTASDLASDFDNWWTVLRHSYSDRLRQDQEDALRALDARLDRLTNSTEETWSLSGLRSAGAWDEVRHDAAAALAAFAWPYDPPAPYQPPAGQVRALWMRMRATSR